MCSWSLGEPNNASAHIGLRIELLEGGRYVSIPLRAVNGGYDALPSRSAESKMARDKSLEPLGLPHRREWLVV